MSDWAKTRRVRGRIVLTAADPLVGDLHLQPLGAPGHPMESPLEMLNRPEPFFAVSVDDGVQLVAKAAVVAVSLDSAASEDHPFAHPGELEVLMDDGQEYRGAIDIELPPPARRPLDFLNQPEPFFALRAGDRCWYLARGHVVRARPLD
ncbi:MAG: hypothetical protein RLN75_03215 [Longimicrobiales bacterium]